MTSLAQLLDQAVRQYQTGNLQAAEQLYRKILDNHPQHVDALHFIGLVAAQSGKHEQAADYIRQALRLKPDFAEAHFNLGNVYREQCLWDEAVASYRQALRLKPDLAEAHNNLGNALRKSGKLKEALANFQQAVRLKPHFADGYYNMGTVLIDLEDLNQAAACYQRALELKPDNADIHANLGVIWGKLGQPDEAKACIQRALLLEPNNAVAHYFLGRTLRSNGELTEALACFRRALELNPDYVEAGNHLLHTILFCPGFDNEAIHKEHQAWNERHAQPLAKYIRPHRNDLTSGRRIRVGYVSPDFRDHVVGRNVLPLFLNHDPGHFEVTLYADLSQADAMTVEFQKAAHHWRNITGWRDDRVADKIRVDRIDILVDLALHMESNRLLVFARKPAPIQVTFAGYPGSTGLTAIDYRLTDPYLDSPGLFDAWYSEKSIRLQNSFWCYDPRDNEPPVNELPALKNGYLTFGCLNHFSKVNVPILKIWARVLRAVESSRLILLAPVGKHRDHVIDVLKKEGIREDRITFFASVPRREYLKLYHRIDVGLDTLPYNGHTTSLDSLWMGVPILTLIGETVVGRAGFSQTSNLELSDWVAFSPEALVEIAREVSSNLPRLRQLRAALRARMQSSILMDAPNFARAIEAAYRDMWNRWCADHL